MPTLDPNLYTVAWIAPLEIEVRAALHMLDKVHSGGFPVGPGDDYLFHAGEIYGHNVVVATFAAGQPYGTNSATSLASHVRKFFPNLWFGLLVGVAAGLPNFTCSPPRDIRLGDVLVALPDGENPAIVPYELGKRKGDNGFELLCGGRSLRYQTERIVGSAIGKIKAGKQEAQVIRGYYENILDTAAKFPDPGQENDFLYSSGGNTPVSREHRPDGERTRVWYGSIGSGDKLLKSSQARDELRDKYNVIGLEMEAAGVLNEIPVGNIRGVCDYGDEQKNKDWQPYAAVMAAAFARAVLAEIPPKHMAPTIPTRFDFTDEDKRCLQDLLLTNPEDERRRIEETKGGLVGDSFRWILDNCKFKKWRHSSQSELLWIKGDAGKGKTMLMIGIIKELLWQKHPTSSSQLLAFFLCQATSFQLNNATAILRAWIYMLITQQPSLISHLRERYNTEGKKLFESGDAFFSLSGVFENMIQSSAKATVYLLVDALDECEVHLPELLRLITRSKSTSSVHVKVIVSSRNRDDIEQLLDIDSEEHKLSLELNAHHISLAVGTYIDYKLSQLTLLRKDADLKEQIRDQLYQKSGNTFLWVALVVQELQKCWLPGTMAETVKKTPGGLGPFYDEMVQHIQSLEKPAHELCVLILSIVILAYRPLHLQEMCLLVGRYDQAHGMSDVEAAVGMCGSFLTMRNQYVYFIHQSAKDHLDDKASATIFPLGRSEIHGQMFNQSLQALSINLRRNIYDLKDPGVSVSEIITPQPDPIFSLRYSCTFWLGHFVAANLEHTRRNETTAIEAISIFFKEHLLHYLESLSLIGELSSGYIFLLEFVNEQLEKELSELKRNRGDLRSISGIWRLFKNAVLTQSTGHDRHESIFVEAANFTKEVWSTIEKLPLQTYGSALTFCPRNSEIKKLYWGERLSFIDRVSIMQVLEGNTDSVTAVTFSPDGHTISSASNDETIRLWDAVTGAEIETNQHGTVLASPADQCYSASLSPNGKLFDSGLEKRLNKIFVQDEWITRNGQRLIWLPPEYRATCVATRDNIVVLGHKSGDLTFLWLA